MSGYGRVQELRTKLKPFRKYSGHYTKTPDVKLLLQENALACQQFMQNKPTTELSTINTKVLLHWAECLYALGRKFGEKKLIPIACEKYEIVAKYTGPQDDYLVYLKWAIAECEQSLYSVFFKDGRGKKGMFFFSSFYRKLFYSVLFNAISFKKKPFPFIKYIEY